MPLGGISSHVSENREEPRTKRTFLVEPVETAQGPVKGVLHQIFRVVTGGCVLPRHSQCRAEISGHQGPKRLVFTGLCLDDQIEVCDIVEIHRFRVTSLAASRTVQLDGA